MLDHATAVRSAPLRVIVNPIAGGGRAAALAAGLRGELLQRGVPCEFLATSKAGQAREFAAAAPGAVAVVGGDGTLHEVVDGLVAREGGLGPLAVLPAGSGDDFANGLGSCRAPAALAAELAAWMGGGAAQGRRVDLGLARFHTEAGVVTRRFANLAGLGFLAEVAAAAHGSRLRGRLRYSLATVAALRRLREFAVSGDGGRQRCAFVQMANGPLCGGGLRIAPMADFGDGKLDSLRVGPVGRAGLLCLLAKLVVGRHLGDRRVHHEAAARVVLDMDPPVRAMVDGELVAGWVSRAEFECLGASLWVIGAGQDLCIAPEGGFARHLPGKA